MDRRNTLTSQTVQCPYCGEYYSVTYSSCPFCDGAQREAEAEKNRAETAAEKSSRPRTSGGEKKRRQEKPAESGGFLGKLFGGGSSSHTSEPRSRNLTEDEKARRRAERAERAAQRKRERDRLAGIEPEEYEEYRPEPAPVEPDPNEMEVRHISIDSADGQPVIDIAALLAQVNRAVEPQPEETPAAPSAEAAPAEETPAAPEQSPAPAAEEPAPERPAPAPVQEAPAPAPAEEKPAPAPVQEKPAAPARPEKPEAKQPFRFPPLHRPADESESLPQIVDLNDYPVEEEEAPAPAQEESRPAAAPKARVSVPDDSAAYDPATYATGGDDLDTLLAEVRSMLGDSPVPDLSDRPGAYFAPEEPAAEEPEQAVQPEEETVSDDAVNNILAEVAALLHNSPVQELLNRVKPAEEEPETEPEEQAASDEIPADEAPAESVPAAEETPAAEEIPAEAPAAEEEPAEEPIPVADQEREARRAALREARKQRQKSKKKSPVTPQMILSLVIILVAVAILVHTFGGKKPTEPEPEATVEVVPDTCESFTLDQTDITVNEPGVTVPLNVIFQPEGTSATLTWTSSDENVAAVDQNGVVTAVGPGTAWIAASSASGLSAGCNVNCSWEGAAAPAAGTADAGTAAAGPKLSNTDITLDSSGATKLLTVEGASSIVTWSSDNTSVARVATDGTVTAINKGNATVSAVVDGETLICKVRCVW